MDRLIYIAMNGAKHSMEQQALLSHNLANASTTGFKADIGAFRALPVYGQGAPTRVFAVDSTVGTDFTPGPLQSTGRPMDVAVKGQGFIAVQGADGKEAYTRDGALELNANGNLQTRQGLNVLGERGPIVVAPNTIVTVGADGTVSTVPTDAVPSTPTIVGQIKRVNPAQKSLAKGTDGLFRQTDGKVANADPTVSLATGVLEGSNVSMADALVGMITQARQFETQIKLLQNAETNDRSWDQVLNLAG